MTTLGFRKLCARVSISTSDVFSDLGSGTGRIVLQAAREFAVRKAIGIELSSGLHGLALAALAREVAHLDGGRVRFVLADCVDARLWRHSSGSHDDGAGVLMGTTVLYMGSLLFGEELMARLAQRIAACPTVRVVATLQQFPVPLEGFYEEMPPESCETSWMAPKSVDNPLGLDQEPGSPVHIYIRGCHDPADDSSEDGPVSLHAALAHLSAMAAAAVTATKVASAAGSDALAEAEALDGGSLASSPHGLVEDGAVKSARPRSCKGSSAEQLAPEAVQPQQRRTIMACTRVPQVARFIALAWAPEGASEWVFREQRLEAPRLELRLTDQRGIGGFALRPVAYGERLLEEASILELRLDCLSESSLDTALRALSPQRQAMYRALCMHGTSAAAERTAAGIWLSNAHPTDEVRICLEPPWCEDLLMRPLVTCLCLQVPHKLGAVFRVASRLNHACVPNACLAWNARTRRITVHAIAPIREGDEVTVSYSMLEEGGGTRAARQSMVRKRFGFECLCAQCAVAESDPAFAASETRRTRIVDLARRIVDLDGPVATLVEERLALQSAEGLGPSLESMKVAEAYLRLVGDMDGACAWARRVADVARRAFGEDSDMHHRFSAEGYAEEEDAQQALMQALATFHVRAGLP